MSTTTFREIQERLGRIVEDAQLAEERARLLDDENAMVRRAWSEEVIKLKLKVEDLEAKLAEHKRLAQEKVDALEELLSKATLPEEDREAPKAPAVEVMPGPGYVTRAELRTALAHVAVQFGGPVHEALRHVAHELVKP